MHMTIRSQCETEDSHTHLTKESPVPRVTMGRGFFAHGVHMNPVLIQKITVRWKPAKCSTKVQRPVRSMVCWKTFVTCGLGEVLPHARCVVCHLDTRRPSKGRTRRG